jgi:hypothetical protein
MPKVTDLESLFEEDKKFIISKDYDGYIQNYRNTFECKGSQNHHIVPKYTWGVGDDKIYDSDDYKIYLPCIKHACAHYIRYLKEGNHKDLKACLIILHEQNASYYTEKELRFKSWLSNFVSNNSVSRFKSWENAFAGIEVKETDDQITNFLRAAMDNGKLSEKRNPSVISISSNESFDFPDFSNACKIFIPVNSCPSPRTLTIM